MVTEEGDARPQEPRPFGPLQRGEAGAANAFRQCRARRFAGRGCAHLFVQEHSAQACLAAQHEVIALLVPLDRFATLDLVGQRGDHVLHVERSTDADARVVAFAVEVGRHDEPLVRQRVGGRRPRRRTGAQLKLAGLASAHGHTIRVGEGEHDATALGAHLVEVEAHLGTACDVGGAVAHAGHIAPVGSVVVLAADHPDAQRKVGRQLIGPAAEHVALVEQRGHHAGKGRIRGRRAGDHAGEPWVQGKGQHLAAALGQAAVLGECIQSLQQFGRLLDGARGRCVGPAQFVDRRAPRGQFQHQPGEVDLGDLGFQVCTARAVLQLAPQPVGGARLGAPCAPGALVSRGTRRADGGESAHPGALVEAGHAGEAGVDDDPHTVDRQRRLGDVGGQHDPPASGRGGGERLILLGQAERTGQRVHVDARRQNALQQSLHATDLADAGQEHQHVPWLLAERPLHQRGHRLLHAVLLAHRRPHEVHRVHPAVAGGHWRLRAQHLQQPLRVGGGRHREDADVGAQGGARIQQQCQAEVGGQVAFVHLVEDHQPAAVERRVVLQPTGEHALGHHLDARGRADVPLVAGLVADRLADPFAQ